MTLLPVYLPQGMTLTHLSNAMLPWPESCHSL
jgi:hypothetical protein